MFLLIGLLLVLATTAVMIWPLLRRSPAADTGPDDEALARVFKDRRVLIQQELQSGLIEPHEAQRAEEALAQELADRLQTSALESPKETSV
ncbi:MAG: c-type cytochrome biogenesis protein CcmI, partial [Betaproteobacteria bacterium]|nr:c-type cytochrome biogenesis protein CcmI [Betaproteobacteria bacterium]